MDRTEHLTNEDKNKEIDKILDTKDPVKIFKTQEPSLRQLLDTKVKQLPFDREIFSVFKATGVDTIGDIMICWPRIYWECIHRQHSIKMIDTIDDLMESLRLPLPSPLKNHFSKLQIE